MNPVAVTKPLDHGRAVVFKPDRPPPPVKVGPPIKPMPAVVYPNNKVHTEWAPTKEEREAIAKGANIAVWIDTRSGRIPPLSVEVAK